MIRPLRRTLVCLTLLALLSGIVPVSASAAFQDVPDGHWASDSIRRSAGLGFLQGQTATRFGLGEEMTRASFAVVLCRLYDWDPLPVEESSFQDVPADAAYAGAVEALLSHGVLTLQRPDFRPADALTREDLAVMLVRSLGYGALAGLVQDLPIHFRDVYTNVGYIALAYNLGLMNGTSVDTFSPHRSAPREEIAVTLVRLYDKLHTGAPEVAAVISAPEDRESAPDMTGLDVVSIPAWRLMGVGNAPAVTPAMAEETAARLRDDARAAGAAVLLHVTGGPSTLDAPQEETIALLTSLVESDGYDGLHLDIPEVRRDRRKELTPLIQDLRAALGEDTLLYVTVEAPAWNGREYGGYDYTAIAAAADRMVLRVAAYTETRAGEFPVTPVDPLEEVYYALTAMKGRAELSRLSLLVNTAPVVRGIDGRLQDPDWEELEDLLASGERNYSQRYGCAYMEARDRDDNPIAVWYLDRQSIQARRQMLQAFGIHHLCLSQWSNDPLGLLVG